VTLKIVFNRKEYDNVDAMPPDVRKEYEVALETLRKSGGEEILSVLQRDMGVSGTHSNAAARAIRPPPLGVLWRVVLWIGVGAAAAWWLLRRG
jgi:hypothetical protein